MKRVILSAILIIGMFFGISNYASASQKVAVIDITAVISQSKDVKTLKAEQQKKMKDLEKWMNTAKADIDKQQTKEDKDKLIKKYNEEFIQKRDDIVKDYQTRLQAVDKKISDAISAQAKLKGYDMVIPKHLVVYGGDDITKDVQKAIK